MKARSYLKMANKLDAMIKNKMFEKQKWHDIALCVTSNITGERVKSSGSKSRMADASDEKMDIEREIDETIKQLIENKMDIIRTIEQLPTAEYDVIHRIYIRGLDYFETASEMGKSYSWVKGKRSSGLKHVQEIIDRNEIHIKDARN